MKRALNLLNSKKDSSACLTVKGIKISTKGGKQENPFLYIKIAWLCILIHFTAEVLYYGQVSVVHHLRSCDILQHICCEPTSSHDEKNGVIK